MIFNLFIRIAYEKYFVYESLNLYVVYFAMYDSVLILLLNYGHHDWFNKVFLFLSAAILDYIGMHVTSINRSTNLKIKKNIYKTTII